MTPRRTLYICNHLNQTYKTDFTIVIVIRLIYTTKYIDSHQDQLPQT